MSASDVSKISFKFAFKTDFVLNFQKKILFFLLIFTYFCAVIFSKTLQCIHKLRGSVNMYCMIISKQNKIYLSSYNTTKNHFNLYHLPSSGQKYAANVSSVWKFNQTSSNIFISDLSVFLINLLLFPITNSTNIP